MLTKEKFEQAVRVTGSEKTLKAKIKYRLKELYSGKPYKVKTGEVNLIEIIINEILSAGRHRT